MSRVTDGGCHFRRRHHITSRRPSPDACWAARRWRYLCLSSTSWFPEGSSASSRSLKPRALFSSGLSRSICSSFQWRRPGSLLSLQAVFVCGRFVHGVSFNAAEVPKAKEREGHGIFYRDDGGEIFHTYSCYDRRNA